MLIKAVQSIVVVAVLAVATTGTALARDQVIFASLAQPAVESRFVANAAVWSCEGQTCVARTSQSATVRTCRQFVREVGVPVTSFGPENASLSEDALAQCNDGVAPQIQQAQN